MQMEKNIKWNILGRMKFVQITATYTNNICPTAPDTVIVQDVRTLDIETDTRLGPIEAFVLGFHAMTLVL